MSSSFNFFLHGRKELKGEVDRIRKGHIVERKISVVGQSSVQSHGSMFKCCFPPSPPGGIWVYCASWSFDEMATDMLCAQCPGSQLSSDIEGERERSQHNRAFAAKRVVPNYCHFNEKYEGRCIQAKVRESCSFS